MPVLYFGVYFTTSLTLVRFSKLKIQTLFQIRASEDDGIVSLLVVRAQGMLGQVSVEWRTTDGTAKSEGRKIPPDYVVSVVDIGTSVNLGEWLLQYK